MRKRLLMLSFVLFAVCSISATVLFAADMFSGTWKINLTKSKYDPGPAPKSGTVKIDASAGMKIVTDGVDSAGLKTHNEYTYKFDGKDYPMKPMLDGKPDPNGADMTSGKKIDDFTYETTTKLKGNVLLTTKAVVSKDGKTRTLTQTGKNAQGKTVNNVIVYDKQ